MQHRRIRTVFAIIFMVGFLYSTLAQDQEAPKDRLRLMVFPAMATENSAADTSANQATAANLSQSTINLVQQSEYELVIAPSWQQLHKDFGATSLEFAIIFEAARYQGAQSALFINFFREGRRITLIGKVYDIWQERIVASATRTGLDDLGLLNLSNELTNELLGKLKIEAPQLIAQWGTNGVTGMSRSLLFRSKDEFLRVSLEGGEELGIIHHGTLKIPYKPLAVQRDIRVLLEKPGYYPKTFQFQVDELNPEIKLPALYPKSKWSLMAATDPQWIFGGDKGKQLLDFGLGLGLRYYIVDEYWHLQFWYTLRVPHMRNVVTGVAQPLWLMHDLSLSLQFWLLPPDSFFRVSVGLGLGTYITAGGLNGEVSFTDPYLEVPAVGIQFNLHPIVIDIELGSQFVLDLGNNLLPQGLVRNFGPLRIGVGYKW